ncbi:hypothetical protein [Campylobacter curvus]|uniref:hypothetical protein n=1 Tax=Campylobacter curvus TaxID=200 RepID=UPI0014707111|nr:hypothetical protein [Campylobacter curvus]
MQRNSTDLQFLKELFGIVFLIAYEIATTQLGFLPPLMGLFFTYLILEYTKKQKRYTEFDFYWYFAITFLLFCEQIHGFYLFSSVIAFLIFYNFVVDWLFVTMKWRNCLLAIFVTSGYAMTFLVNNLIAYMENGSFLSFGIEYFFYIVIETILAIILFRDRVV